MGKKFLDNVYDESTPEETRVLYDQWAATYDSEVGENGYVTPTRAANALFKALPQPRCPILDFGCGTGLSGLALRQAGFEIVDGMDPSAEMLEGAKTKGIYRQLSILDVTDEAPIPQGTYKAIAAIGVIGTGAAPADTLHILMKALGRGDLLVFSLNDHALADWQYECALTQWLDCGAAQLLIKNYGPHLPGQELKSNVYIVEKN